MRSSHCVRPLMFMLGLLGTAAACLHGARALAVEPLPREMQAAAQWVTRRFDAAAPAQLPFSFCYGGAPSRELLANWAVVSTARELDAQRQQLELTSTDPQTGLVVRCLVTVYRDFPAVEWVVWLKNTGRAATPILQDVQALDTPLDWAAESGPVTLHYAEGSRARISDFQPLERVLGPGDRVDLASFGGRSSDTTLPFFNLALPGDAGLVIGIGWTGQWAASFECTTRGGIHARAGMEHTHVSLQPGEEIRTPAVLALCWSGADRLRGQNLLRQLLLRHATPQPGGRPVEPPCAASPHAVVGFEDTTADNMLRAIANLAAHRAPVDYWWIDAGWYTCGRNWARFVGNLDPDPTRFPHGLRPIADAAHEAGMKFLLWCEPERVMPDTWLYDHHPEWLLRPTDEMPPELKYQITDKFFLLDLGNPDALAWVKTKLSDMIGSQAIDCYRNDFNMYPLYYWRNAEPADRQGMREIRYVLGLYDLFDTLQQRHPQLLLDNCASGGRRIDFEMLRRALVLTRSDYLWDPIGQQCHTYGLAQWIPLTGIGAASIDVYQCRSGLGSHFALATDYYSDNADTWAGVARAMRECKSLQHLYSGDFYPLGSYSTANDTWMAWQFHRPDLQAGVLQAFRREQCTAETAVYRLQGLDPERRYTLTNADSPQASTMTGKELMENGYTVQLAGKPAAAVVTYVQASE